MQQFVMSRVTEHHDRDFKTRHVHVTFTVSGWKNSWNENLTEYMDVSGILSEEKANLIAAAPDLLEAAAALLADVRRRYPGEELRCPFMIRLDAAVAKAEGTP